MASPVVQVAVDAPSEDKGHSSYRRRNCVKVSIPDFVRALSVRQSYLTAVVGRIDTKDAKF